MFWQVAWLFLGVRHCANLPSEFVAREFAQVCALLSDVSDVHVLPPIGSLDLSPAQVARSARASVMAA